eukprot:TRINITY_DN10686_c0_g1_i1.p1 TRINITY_DN10686_c0_g1~~TRINITY_DN10686_c0_g1_i1.p1  ORF type:complete len:356 (-),score=87.90 TRINITY_DN10686_c0_g1_i1:178-1143(-)
MSGLKLGTDSIISMMCRNKSVTALNITANRLQESGGFALAQCFKDSKLTMPLEELQICENVLGNAAVQELLQSMMEISFSKLMLDWNQLSDESVEMIKKFISVQKGLKKLTLAMNEFTPAALRDLFACVRTEGTSSSLDHFDVSCSLSVGVSAKKNSGPRDTAPNQVVVLTRPSLDSTDFLNDDFGLPDLIQDCKLTRLGFIELFTNDALLRILRALEFNNTLQFLAIRFSGRGHIQQLIELLKVSSIEEIAGDRFTEGSEEVQQVLKCNREKRCTSSRFEILRFVFGLSPEMRNRADWRLVIGLFFEYAGLCSNAVTQSG